MQGRSPRPEFRDISLGLQGVYGKLLRSPLPPHIARLAEELAHGLAAAGSEGQPVALVADPDDASRNLAGVLLEEVGFRVISAADGAEAYRKAEANAGQLAFAFVDGALPGAEGQGGVASGVSGRCPDIVVVVAAERDTDPDTEDASRSLRVIRKPWLPLDLLREAEHAMERATAAARKATDGRDH